MNSLFNRNQFLISCLKFSSFEIEIIEILSEPLGCCSVWVSNISQIHTSIFIIQDNYFPKPCSIWPNDDYSTVGLGENSKIKIKTHTRILIGNQILNLICFLQFFCLSTPSAAKMRFYFLHFLQGKNVQNRPENQKNWNLA